MFVLVFFFKQKTAYEMRISDWSSDVCSSDLRHRRVAADSVTDAIYLAVTGPAASPDLGGLRSGQRRSEALVGLGQRRHDAQRCGGDPRDEAPAPRVERAEQVAVMERDPDDVVAHEQQQGAADRKSTRLNSSH